MHGVTGQVVYRAPVPAVTAPEFLLRAHLLDAVGVDGGLGLQDADRFRFGHILGHLPNLVGNEAMNGIESFHCALDEAHALCGTCKAHHVRAAVKSLSQVLNAYNENKMSNVHKLYHRITSTTFQD